MIVITSMQDRQFHLVPGDRFQLQVTDITGATVVIDEAITVAKTINYIASFRFASEDGTCQCFHLCGVFGDKAELPKEIMAAVRFEELSPEQRENFLGTVGVNLELRQ